MEKIWQGHNDTIRNIFILQPQFFTPTEVDSILAIANKKDWDEGRINVNEGDPDREGDDTGAVNSEIRQSQVKWLMVN